MGVGHAFGVYGRPLAIIVAFGDAAPFLFGETFTKQGVFQVSLFSLGYPC